jgi:ELWxxDGT repeat protein
MLRVRLSFHGQTHAATIALGAALLLGLAAPSARAETAVLLKDINKVLSPRNYNSEPSLTRIGDIALFSAIEHDSQPGLWRTDGTGAGTTRLKAFGMGPWEITASADAVYFLASDPAWEFGLEPWKTDGSTVTLLKDIRPGPEGSRPRHFAELDGIMYFTADDGVHGRELWRSDGTEAGTTMVKDINQGGEGACGESAPCGRLYPAGNFLYFEADDGVHGTELWRTDGSQAGTILLGDVAPGPSSSGVMEILGLRDKTLVTLFTLAQGWELWAVEGDPPNLHLVADIGPGTWDGSPRSFATLDGSRAFFSAYSLDGTELWSSDGTQAGTFLVKDINPGVGSSNPYALTPMGDAIYFVASDAAHGAELWKTDGTAPGTLLVRDIAPGAASSLQGPDSPLRRALGGLFFAADDGFHGRELWKSDGTNAGTMLVADIYPYGASDPSPPVDIGAVAVFAAYDGMNGREVWRTDGTAAGTAMVFDVSGPITEGSGPEGFLALHNRTIFRADDGVHGRELWVTDGTEAGTALLRDIRPGPEGSASAFLTALNGHVYFFAWDGTNPLTLWRTDGTTNGTIALKVFDLGIFGEVLEVQAAGDYVFISVHRNGLEGERGPELWRTDGTPEGTIRIKELLPGGPYYSAAHDLTALGSLLFFLVDYGAVGLWRSDGTPGGTYVVKALATTDYPEGAEPGGLVNAGGRLFFASWTKAAGKELWTSDGTPDGTTLAADIAPGPAWSSPLRLTAVGTSVFFAADDGSHGLELWRSNGTPSGTRLVADIVPGSLAGLERISFEMSQVGTRVFFTADDGTSGMELWATDGTPEGTYIVEDLRPGIASGSFPHELTPVDGRLFFSAEDRALRRRLWVSDGTSTGTVPVTSSDGAGILGPSGMRRIGRRVYLGASTSLVDSEPWFVDPPAIATTGLYTLTPCRLVDTRGSDGPALGAQTQRTFLVGGRCGVPETARVVVVNVTVTQATASGHVTLFREGDLPPLASTLNFLANATRANQAIVALGETGSLNALSGQPSGSVHVIIDVSGWLE